MKLLLVCARVFILTMCGLSAIAQPGGEPPPGGQPPPEMPRAGGPRQPDGARSFRSPAGTRAMPGLRDGGTSGPLWLFRQFMREEMENVPLLAARLNELTEIQQQRNVLQKQRSQIAEDRGLSSQESLRKFHDLLKREDDINRRQKTVLEALLRDGPQIQKQIAARRKQIDENLQKLKSNADEKPQPKDVAKRQNLEQAGKFYEFLQNRVGSLQDNPDRVDLLNRFFRGIPNLDEPEPGNLDEARARLQRIIEEHHELENRVEGLEDEIRQLRQLLRSPGSVGQRWRGHRGDNAPAQPPPPKDGATTAVRQGAPPPGPPPDGPQP